MGYEGAILRSIEGALKYRERLEAERKPTDPPLDDAFVTLNGIANFLHVQGMMIACLALEPDTSSELLPASAHAAQRVPAWMEMWVFEEASEPARMFAQGLAQLLGEQRATIERIVEEQVDDPEPIEATLAERPVPAGTDDESTDELFLRAGEALRANLQATLEIARDLDNWLEELRTEE